MQFIAEARQNEKNMIRELEARVARLGNINDFYRQYDQQVINMRTCRLCGFLSKTIHHLEYRHKGSKACEKLQAEKRGVEFVSKPQRVLCVCGSDILRCNLKRHLTGALHKNNLARQNGIYCLVCDPLCKKPFGGRRPKKCYTQHCRGKKHRARVNQSTRPDRIQTPDQTSPRRIPQPPSVSSTEDQSPRGQLPSGFVTIRV